MAIPFIGAITGVASSIVTWLIMRVVAIFGIGFVSIVGVKPFLTSVLGTLRNLLNLNGSTWTSLFQWLGVLQFDVCISIILSAITAKLLFNGLTSSGDMKKIRLGGGGG